MVHNCAGFEMSHNLRIRDLTSLFQLLGCLVSKGLMLNRVTILGI